MGASSGSIARKAPWRGGRVVDGSGLENRRRETFRGFESRPLRFYLCRLKATLDRIAGWWRSGWIDFIQVAIIPEVIRLHGLLGAKPFAIGELILVKVVEAFRLKLQASPAAIASVHD